MNKPVVKGGNLSEIHLAASGFLVRHLKNITLKKIITSRAALFEMLFLRSKNIRDLISRSKLRLLVKQETEFKLLTCKFLYVDFPLS